MSDDHTYSYSDLWHSQNSLFKHFQEYLGIFRGIDQYSATFTSAQLGGRGEASPVLFENRKKCLGFGKKGPDCDHWVKLSIQNVLLRIPRRKNTKMDPCGASFLVFLPKYLSMCSRSINLYLPAFLQNPHLKCLTVF